MIPVVVLVVALATPIFSLPLSTQEFITTGTQDPQTISGSIGFINPQVITGEKSQVEGVSQAVAGTSEGSFTEASGTKTGVEGVPSPVTQNTEKTENEAYSELGQTVQAGVTRVNPSTPAQYSGLKTPSHGAQVPSTSHQYSENYPQNTPVPKGEQVEHKQPSQPENPLLLPIQPLTVVPVNQVGGLLQPVVVPAEALTAGRLIIMTINPVQKRSFQDISTTPEMQIPDQRVTQPVTYTSEQAQQVQQIVPVSAQPVEKQEAETDVQNYSQVQHQSHQTPFVKEQAIHNPNILQQGVEPVQNYGAVPNPQVYNVQPNVPSIVTDYVEKQVPQQSTSYTPVESTAPQQQTYNVQQSTDREYEQGVQTSYQQQDNHVFQAYQPHQSVQKQFSDPNQQQKQQVTGEQRPAERQTQYQHGEYIPVQNHPSVQQLYNTQTEIQQSHVPVEYKPVQQKVSTGHPEYQETHTPVQPQLPEQTQGFYQSGAKQTQPIQSTHNVDVHPEEPSHQHQVSNLQFASNQAETQPEYSEYVPQQLQKTSASHLNQQSVYGGSQPQQVVNYAAEPVYDFGEKVHQDLSAQQISPITSCSQ